MRSVLFSMAGLLILTELSATGQASDQKRPKTPDQWRYVIHDGMWWYWLPEGRWVYWQRGRWNVHSPSVSALASRAGVNPDARTNQGTVPCILWASERTPAKAPNGKSQSSVGPAAARSPPTRMDLLDASPSESGPLYDHVGPAMEYPAISMNSEVGPFYGKADARAGASVDMSHFPGY